MKISDIARKVAPALLGMGMILNPLNAISERLVIVDANGKPVPRYEGEVSLERPQETFVRVIGDYEVSDRVLGYFKLFSMERAGNPDGEYTDGRYETSLLRSLVEASPDDRIIGYEEGMRYLERQGFSLK